MTPGRGAGPKPGAYLNTRKRLCFALSLTVSASLSISIDDIRDNNQHVWMTLGRKTLPRVRGGTKEAFALTLVCG